MTIRDDLPSLYVYTRWADARMMEVVRQLSPEQYVQEPTPGWASVRSSIVHMGGAMWMWAHYLDGEPVSARPTEDEYSSVDDAHRLLSAGHDAFDRLVAPLTPEQLASIWEATDPRGKLRRIPFWAVYRHVANHQTYHRGQVASKLKRLGVDAPFTDLVVWAVENTPQP
jgi:uncharacterized damage-inducible protein DinB